MVSRSKRRKQKKWHHDLSHETKESIAAIVAFLLGLMTILAWLGKAGWIGTMFYKGTDSLFGGGYLLLPLVFFLLGFAYLLSIERRFFASAIIGGVLFLLSGLGLTDIIFGAKSGGLIGMAVAFPFLRFFDIYAASIILGAVFIVGILITFNIPLNIKKLLWTGTSFSNAKPKPVFQKGPEEDEPDKGESLDNTQDKEEEEEKKEKEPEKSPEPEEEFVVQPKLSSKKKDENGYVFPPLSLLDNNTGTPSSGDIKANSNIIQRTLEHFGIPVEMGEINIGPSVTQYTLKPAQGIKLSRIVALQNDLALALAAHPLRLEAPIPKRSLVGIEIPNRSIALVGLRNLLDQLKNRKAGPLVFPLGMNVRGEGVFANLATMPHLLVAGSTGTGKSVGIHCLVSSLLYRNSPQVLRFLFIDPKRVELPIYNNIPHLLAPVITDAKKTVMALRWAVREMDKRYDLLSELGSRDIDSYNTVSEERIPYIIIVIDELADLMASYGREIEASIVRLAQMARAVGIHLVVSTQRPSVEVITGLIKANITSRIAFQVASQVDSRTILDGAGAEKLLGNGDMLYLSGDIGKPRRIQGSFITEKEVKKVAEFLKKQGGPLYEEDFNGENVHGAILAESDGADDDELYAEACQTVRQSGKASASLLQRRLRVGYARAARLLDVMEEKGVVGPGDGAKPREVFIKNDEENSFDAQ
ncbi:DNA translocase FtsK [Patescibacteria group bacterium]